MKSLQVSLYWLIYRHNNSITIVIEPAPSLNNARLRAALDGLDEGEFTEGHELLDKRRVLKQVLGRRTLVKERCL